ncbi:bidirectional sugar transporter SWEET12 [Spatholobus suberectus]|nr:bidirectional sugar transporter SWEET12 [Spatholobus suberectus]
MKENTELEEGEACYYKGDDEGKIYLDSLTYIDEKIQHVLGHFQKDFEGGVSAENLGAKFGGYGSFLPAQERSSCVLSHPRTPQRNHSSPNSNINLHKEAVSHNTKAPSNVPPSARLENTSCSSHSFRDLRAASVNDSVKKECGISSSDIGERSTLKDDTTKKPGNSTDQRTLKFRIKMKSNILAQKNAEIYSGLGLDNSPSSSMGSSPVESEGMPPVSQANAEDSPTGIIQVMTSFPIPGGVLISPLHESLLCLIKNDRVIGDSRYLSSLNGHQDPCSMSTDESDSFVGDGHLKKRTVRIVRQSEKQLELKHMNGTLSEKDTTLHTKRRLGNRTPDRKDFLSNELKCTPPSSSICDAGETAEVTAKASEASKEFNENGVQGRIVSMEALKESSLESISGQDEKQNAGNGFMKNAVEHKLENSHKDNSTDPKNNNMRNTFVTSNKVERDAIKCKVEKYETHQKVKVVSEQKNKSKGDQSPGRAEAVARKDSFDGTNNAMVIDKGSTGFDNTCRSKMNKSKSLKHKMFSDSNRDLLKERKSEWKVDSLAGNGATKNANISNGKQSAFEPKAKERPSGHKVVNQLLAGPCIKDTSASLLIAENNPAPEMIPSTVAAPQLIEEDWVCCDRCQKWRLLPYGIKPEHLPEKWLCSMLNWLPGMNSCDFSEDDTKNALYALYQMPISEGQNNMQSHGTETAIGVSSTNALQYGLNHRISSSDMLSDRGKKKHVIKEKTMSGTNNDVLQFTNSAKTNAQVSGKNRSLNSMNQHPADLKPMKKTSSSKHLSRLDNMIEEKLVPKDKEKQVNGGDRKHVKLKRKMDADQYKSGTPKKSKTGNVCYADKQLNPGMGLEKVALYSRNNLPTKASGKDMRNYDEYCLSEDVEDNRFPVTVKKEGDQAQVSSGGGGSLDVKNSIKSDGLVKKRKLKDRLDDEKHNNSYSLHGEKQYGEEGNASELRKEKKYRILNKEAKSVTEGDDKLSKGGMREVYLSGNRDQMAVGTEVRFVDKGNQLRKHRKNIASIHASDGIDQLGKDLGSELLSLAATSSSSKVSGSHKTKINFEDVRGSPVESVTSSPLRAFNLDKHILAGDTSVKEVATKGRLSSVSSRRSVDNREGKLSVNLKVDRISHDLHPASHKLSSVEYQVEDTKDKARVEAKKSSELKNNHLLEGGVHVEQPGYCANGIRHEEKVNKDKQESELSWQKSGKVTSLHIKEKGRKSGSHVSTDKMKISVSETGDSKNSGRYDSVVDPSNHASGAGTKNDAKYTSLKSKSEIDCINQKSALRYGPNETGKQTELKQGDLENSVPKMDAQCSTDRKTISRQNLTQDFEEENKANHVSTESRVGQSKVLSSAVGEVKRETLNVGSRTVPHYQKGSMSNEHAIHVSGNGDLAKSMRNYAHVSNNAVVNYSSGNFASDQQLTVSSPLRTNSNQTAVDTLEEATKLKDRADNYKNSGFDFESNETYFQAGLKFLHGASLLENCHNESSKHGEMSQVQIFATAAKLFECCAHEYETCQEMAAAALAYKCMEVAYMRVVYCKNSSANRDRNELQSTLQMISQGESPSSSASDVDNLNHQAAADKATLPRGTNTHVAINQVISARTHPNLVRLLDFTRDIQFAMEASRKCQSTFTAANVIMEESQNKDCITSIRSVIDFSFHDIEELVRLVWTATKAISRAGLGGARD